MGNRKDIKQLSDGDARQVFEYVFPPSKDGYRHYTFTDVSFEAVVTENGQQVSLGLRPLVGINYHNGQDRCILHFDNTKVVSWLYENGYDIKDLLDGNEHLSEMEGDFENFSFAIHWLAECMEKRGDPKFNRNNIEYNIEYVIKQLRDLNEKYYYKDYE